MSAAVPPADGERGPDAEAPPADENEEVRRPPRWIVRAVLAFIVVRVVVAYAVEIVAPTLVPNPETGNPGNPLLLMLLNTRKRWLLAAKDEPFHVYFPLGVVGQLLSDPFFYLLGRWYGEGGIRWAKQRFGDVVEQFEKLFAKAGLLLVVIAPNQYTCLLAGASRMAPPLFLAANVAGTIVTVLLARWVGDTFSGPLDVVFSFTRRYQWQLVALSAVLFAIQIASQRKKGTGEVASVGTLERELEQAASDAEAGGDGPPTEPGSRDA